MFWRHKHEVHFNGVRSKFGSLVDFYWLMVGAWWSKTFLSLFILLRRIAFNLVTKLRYKPFICVCLFVSNILIDSFHRFKNSMGSSCSGYKLANFRLKRRIFFDVASTYKTMEMFSQCKIVLSSCLLSTCRLRDFNNDDAWK